MNYWSKLDKKGFCEDILTKQACFGQERLTGFGQETLTKQVTDIRSWIECNVSRVKLIRVIVVSFQFLLVIFVCDSGALLQVLCFLFIVIILDQ